jgi:AbiV family abortive infection protein
MISDAEVLLSAGRWPRAYSLAVLAHEEFGKSLMAMALFSAPDIILRQPRWIQELRSGHVRKLISGYQHQAMVSPDDFVARTLESPDLARTSNEGKQRGFYVDLADESVRPPTDVTEAEARAEVGRVRQMVQSPGLHSMPFWLPATWNMTCRAYGIDMWAIAKDAPNVKVLEEQLAECRVKGRQCIRHLGRVKALLRAKNWPGPSCGLLPDSVSTTSGPPGWSLSLIWAGGPLRLPARGLPPQPTDHVGYTRPPCPVRPL